MVKKQKVVVKLNEENPEPVELIAKSIVSVSEGMQKINNAGLTRRALIVLLQDAIGAGNISRNQIELVLDHLGTLKQRYCKP